VVHRAGRPLRERRFAGTGVECPVCGGEFRSFEPYHGRAGARCPRCLSLERHRLLWLYLEHETNFLTEPAACLHVAPEPALRERLRELPRLDYVSVDLNPGWPADLVADVTDLPFDAASFDLVICNHVLEHVSDDACALAEVHRVLRPGGRALMLHPIEDERPATFEDPAATSGRERRRLFGQRDHVRIYGGDFYERLARAGFEVDRVRYAEALSDDEIRRYGAADEELAVGARDAPR
jgi:SAM-dependent methyltransferase